MVPIDKRVRVTEHEAPYTATPFLDYQTRIEGYRVVTYARCYTSEGAWTPWEPVMPPYDTAAEASGVCQRVKGDRGPEDG